ncbi:MAG: hypothetical protein ACUVXI_11780 [bacterium]
MRKSSKEVFFLPIPLIVIFAWGVLGQTVSGKDLERIFEGAYNFKVGQWVEYEVIDPEEGKGAIKFSIVGAEGGRFWYETKVTSPGGESAVTKFLMGIDRKTGEHTGIIRMIVKSGDDPAIELPIEVEGGGAQPQGGEGFKAPSVTPMEIEGAKFAAQTIKVPAGSFKCYYAKYEGQEVWVSDEVPITPIVRLVNADGSQMILKAMGQSGARTEIAEEPQKLDVGSMLKGLFEGEEKESEDAGKLLKGILGGGN